MYYDAASIIKNELDAGERLLWSGVPKQGVYLQASDILMIPFSLLWGGFSIHWEYLAISKYEVGGPGQGFDFLLFGIPFVFIGLYMIFGRFIYDARRRAKTFYGLTNERVIIVAGLFRKTVKSINLKSLTDISFSEKSDGSGTIIFGRDAQMLSALSADDSGKSAAPRFEFIENAKQVYRELRAQQKRPI